MTSRPAIEPAISTLPVMNQLMAKVSSVPSVRQLTALRTDLACVSAPRNSTRQCLPNGVGPNLARRRAGPLHDPQFPADFSIQTPPHNGPSCALLGLANVALICPQRRRDARR